MLPILAAGRPPPAPPGPPHTHTRARAPLFPALTFPGLSRDLQCWHRLRWRTPGRVQ